MVHLTWTELKFVKDTLEDVLDALRMYEDEQTGIPFGDYDLEERLEQAVTLLKPYDGSHS